MPLDRPRLLRPYDGSQFPRGAAITFTISIPNCESGYKARFYKLPDVDNIVLEIALTEYCRNKSASSDPTNEGIALASITLDLEPGEYLVEIEDTDTDAISTGGVFEVTAGSDAPPSPVKPPATAAVRAKVNTVKKPASKRKK
jgi:hypothetical protein